MEQGGNIGLITIESKTQILTTDKEFCWIWIPHTMVSLLAYELYGDVISLEAS